jgi:hypothetical protein
MTNRVTPENITDLEEGQVFVFGSNLSGIHGAGAARTALKWGATWGVGVGLLGRTYAIPTKSENIERTLTVEEIKPYVDHFIHLAKITSNFHYLVTEIGCGLAGHRPQDIAPLFRDAVGVENISLPQSFWSVIGVEGKRGPNDGNYMHAAICAAAKHIKSAQILYSEGHYRHSVSRVIPPAHPLRTIMTELSLLDNEYCKDANKSPNKELFSTYEPPIENTK